MPQNYQCQKSKFKKNPKFHKKKTHTHKKQKQKKNKWYHAKVLLKRFHLNGHIIYGVSSIDSKVRTTSYRNRTLTYSLLVPKPPWFQNTITSPDTLQFETRLSVLIVTHTGKLVGLKWPSTEDFLLITLIEIVES